MKEHMIRRGRTAWMRVSVKLGLFPTVSRDLVEVR
jgi:hypothetical protein